MSDIKKELKDMGIITNIREEDIKKLELTKPPSGMVILDGENKIFHCKKWKSGIYIDNLDISITIQNIVIIGLNRLQWYWLSLKSLLLKLENKLKKSVKNVQIKKTKKKNV